MKKDGLVISGVYLHISNGGVSFEINDDPKYGPVLNIAASHFGNTTNGMSLPLTEQTVVALRDVFDKAAKHGFSGKKPYCCAAGLDASDIHLLPKDKHDLDKRTVDDEPKGNGYKQEL